MPKTTQIKRKFNTILKPSKIDYGPLVKELLEEYEKWQTTQIPVSEEGR